VEPNWQTQHSPLLAYSNVLQNGKVLVAGGSSAGMSLNSAELYDPNTGMWSITGSLNFERNSHTATLLPNGKVLVTGGSPSLFNATSSAELYDAATETWSITASLSTARFFHTATLLPSGKILVAGGGTDDGVNDIAELYDPATETWTATGSLTTPRDDHTATLLSNGKVLISGGLTFSGDGFGPTNSAELYDPSTGRWTTTGGLNMNRHFQTATLLLDGKVLVVGGNRGNTSPASVDTAELYDPSTGIWSFTSSLNAGRYWHTATLLSNGKVLVAGGINGSGSVFTTLNSVVLYGFAASIDDPPFFVGQHYRDFLNRDADATGLAFWTNEITECGTDAGCIEAKRINVSAAFFLSIEFQQTGYLVYRIYKAAYGNLSGAPVPLKLSECLPDMRQIGQGVIVNQTGWEEVLENNKQAFMADFVQRSRLTSAFPPSLTPTQFVDELFANTGVMPSTDERMAAVNEFGSATTTSDTAARARALRRVAENETLTQQEFNRAFVLMQYFGYLRRNPNDAPEPGVNFDGYNFWLTKLNQFNGNFVQAEMVKAFINSTEYRQRFGQP
jgi:hypothetical protein